MTKQQKLQQIIGGQVMIAFARQLLTGSKQVVGGMTEEETERIANESVERAIQQGAALLSTCDPTAVSHICSQLMYTEFNRMMKPCVAISLLTGKEPDDAYKSMITRIEAQVRQGEQELANL